MTDHRTKPDWDPRSEQVLDNPLTSFDAMREQCPVAHSDYMGWSVFRHADVLAVVTDHETFSNRVSRHRSVPNGMNQPEHTSYRRLIEPFFRKARMDEFEPACRQLSKQLVLKVSGHDRVAVVPEFAEAFALQVQCAFMGWPDRLQAPLRRWAHENFEATLSGDRQATAEVAERFSGYIRELLEERRGKGALKDTTAELIGARIDGQPLPEEDIVSILRNWTVGEIGTITASVSILLCFLAEHPELQQRLRREPERIPEAIDEILRLHGPLVTNRRRALRDTSIGGRSLGDDLRVSVNWISANRDPRAFEKPERFRWGRDHRHNLLYGAGIHVCPGAPLARLELRVLVETLLEGCEGIRLSPGHAPKPAHYPASGYRELRIDFSAGEDL